MFGAQEQPGVPNSALRKVQTSKPQHNFSRKATVTVTVDGHPGMLSAAESGNVESI